MPDTKTRFIIPLTLKCTALAVPMAIVTGALVALFLWLLDLVTGLRMSSPWLVLFLPLGGILIHWLYHFCSKRSLEGNNLIISEIFAPGPGVPAAMMPLVLVSTLITHLFGGSAGREGTAVQMAGSLSAYLAGKCRLSNEEMQVLLIAGIGAGFSAVFGTAVTGAVFAFEVLRRSKLRLDAILPTLLAALLADRVCSGLGIHHTEYSILPGLHFSQQPMLPLFVAGAAVLFGLASRAFVLIEQTVKKLSTTLIVIPWLRPVAGALTILLISYVLGTRDYLGIGIVGRISIVNAFSPGGADLFSWFWKLLLTAVTLGTGFKGGEVTPLFFIGATLGNAFATLTDAPVDLFAGLGFVAVFAGATNTPISCTLMGIELFGPAYAGYFALACFIAYLVSGKRGIYPAQQERRGKLF